MTKEESQIWLNNKFNNCYPVINKPNVIYIYDTQFIRQKKLSRILGEKIVYPEKHSGILLFEQDYKNHDFYVDYRKITNFLLNNYSDSWDDIKELIKDWLKTDTFSWNKFDDEFRINKLKIKIKLAYSLNLH